MRIKKHVRGFGVVVVVASVLAAGIYDVATYEPVAIKVDPRLYDDYTGFFDFGNG